MRCKIKLNKIFGGFVLLGLVGGLLVSGGCAMDKKGKTPIVRTYIDAEKLQNITGNKLINCTNVTIALSFLNSSTRYPANAITNRGSRCMIYFDPSQVSINDMNVRGYTLYIHHDDECVASLYKAPHAKPFFSSAC